MTSRRRFADPPFWPDASLHSQRLQAIENFINDRTREGSALWRAAFAGNVASVEALFAATDDLLTLGTGAALAANPSLLRAARYLGGPPVSEADLDTLAEASIAKRKRLELSLERRAAEVIETALDAERFPWLSHQSPRRPRATERKYGGSLDRWPIDRPGSADGATQRIFTSPRSGSRDIAE